VKQAQYGPRAADAPPLGRYGGFARISRRP